MKRKESPSLPININEAEIVKRHGEEARRIEEDPEAMLHLVDLIFGFGPDRWPVS